MHAREHLDTVADWHMADIDKGMRTHRHMNRLTSSERFLLLLLTALAGYADICMCVLCDRHRLEGFTVFVYVK